MIAGLRKDCPMQKMLEIYTVADCVAFAMRPSAA